MDTNDQDPQSLGNLVSQTLQGSGSLTLRNGSENRASEATAARAAMVIFGCFRKSEADDPEVFLASYEHILRGYPTEVVREVSDPRTGIAGKQTFLPSASELKAACDAIHDPIKRRAETEKKNAAFLAQSIKNKEEEAERKKQADRRAWVADDAMLKAGMIPKEMREGKYKHPDDLVGAAKELRLQELKELDAEQHKWERDRREKGPEKFKIGPGLRKYLDHMAKGGTGDEFRRGYNPGEKS